MLKWSDVEPAEYTATDEDDDDDAATGLTWLLSGADASKFDITDRRCVRAHPLLQGQPGLRVSRRLGSEQRI